MGRGTMVTRWGGLLAALSSHVAAQVPAGTDAPRATASVAPDADRGVVPRFEPVPRDAFPVALGKDGRIDAGYLVVYEDRARPGGRTIRLPRAGCRTTSTRQPWVSCNRAAMAPV